MSRGATSARVQLGVSDTGWHGAEDAIRPGTEGETGRGAEGETGRGGEEDATRPGTGGEERTDWAAPEQPVGQVERTGPVPEPIEARDEAAMMVESVVQPVLQLAPEVVPAMEPVVEMLLKEEPEVMVLGISGDPEQVSPSTTLGAVGVAPSFEDGLDAGQGPPAGVEWAMVQHRPPSNFSRNEWEEEVWKA